MIDWDLVQDRIVDAKGIAFDTCHKIYVLMDDEQMVKMKEYEYDPLISHEQMSADAMFETVKDWYAQSCALKFVEAVSTMPEGEDPNLGFETLIGQFDSDEEECEDCGEVGCYGACYVEEDEDEEDEEDE